MKSRFVLTMLAVAAITLGAWAGGTVDVSENDSQIVWKAKKVGGAHEGMIDLKEANLIMEDGALTGGSFVVDMTSISCTDIEKEAMNAKLVGHLNSSDFFHTEEFPEASFTITSVEKTGDNTYKVTGDMTIKETTAPVTFDATVSKADGKVSATAEIEIDRTVYDVRYGSKKFFDNLGDKFIYDNFTLEVTLVGEAG